MHRPSPQQQAVYDWVAAGSGNLVLEAVAGAGKTSTLVEALKLMRGSIAFAAYNKKIADEIKERVGSRQGVRCGTFHSFGYAAWRRVAPDARIMDKKTLALLDELRVPEEFGKFVTEAVSLAKQRGFGVLCPMDDVSAWNDLVNHFDLLDTIPERETSTSDYDGAELSTALRYTVEVLRKSGQTCREIIDFDDMIWAPLIYNARVWQNDWVLVDEAQDTNPARRALAKKMLRPGGRMVAVGDRHQAIYGFTGADSDSLDVIAQEFGCQRLPLTVSFRCAQRVVVEARTYVHHIEASPLAEAGSVTRVPEDEWWSSRSQLTPDDVILCRNTKPLVELAYRFISDNVAVRVEGRDIGRGLIALANRWRVKSLSALRSRLDQHLKRQTQKLMAKGQESQAASLADKIGTLLFIAGTLPADATVNHLRARVEALFQDSEKNERPMLTLSTIHKAKGREWERVCLFRPDKYMPSPYARQAWQQEQENNLGYVAVTRAKRHLVIVNGPSNN